MHPADETLQRLVRHHQIRTIPPLPAEVLSQSGQALELRLQVPAELLELWGLDAGLQQVPLALQGCWQVQLAQGAKVVVEFLASDPRQSFVRTVISGTILSATLDAAAIAIGPHATAVDLGPAAVKVPVAVTGSSVKIPVPTSGVGTVDNAPPIQSVVKA